ncbi:MAG: ATP-dependent RecD-like DNA helicase [Myxococcota bacterium]
MGAALSFIAAAPMSDVTVDITVEEVSYRSADGSFAVVRGSQNNADGEITLVGDLGTASIGERLRARGRFQDHPTYGERFRVSSYLPLMPESEKGIARYLGSGLIPGVGEGLAERLVKRFGERTLDVVTRESSRLTEVNGIGKKRALAIGEAVRARRDEAEAQSYLRSLGLGPATARKVWKRYGDRTVEVIRRDPYLVAEEVAGIGFTTADAIGRASGIDDDDPRRAAGVALHLTGKAADDGHVFVRREELERDAERLRVSRERLAEALRNLLLRDLLFIEDDAVYPPLLYQAEVRVAQKLTELRQHPREIDPARLAKADAALVPFGLTERQRESVTTSLRERLLVITGGPGTGKTTTTRAIVAAHFADNRRVILGAPTGRAAKRLFEATGTEARTVHRLLEWNPALGRFTRGSSNPLDADLVLIDEASMLDLRLADSLLRAVAPSTTLVLVGDVDQLPPVSPGQVLREVIRSGVCPVVRLDRVFRQAQESAIVQGAHAVLHGDLPEPTPRGERGTGDLFVVRTRDPGQIGQRIIETLDRMKEVYGIDPIREAQVLTPMRRGPVGTERLNQLLQGHLNRRPGGRVPPGALSPGDRVMQLRNDYEKDVFNGDMGEVRAVDAGTAFVIFDGREVRYRRDELDAVALAYASTVHKVQGSEFEAVFIALHAGHHVLLSRALLYTAITRAKRLVVIVGDDRALARAVRNDEPYLSNSRLYQRLRESIASAS